MVNPQRKRLEERARQRELQSIDRTERRTIGEQMGQMVAAGYDSTSGSALDILLETESEADNQRWNINFQSLNKQETYELKAQEAIRQSQLNANAIARQGQVAAMGFHNAAVSAGARAAGGLIGGIGRTVTAFQQYQATSIPVASGSGYGANNNYFGDTSGTNYSPW